MTMPASRFLKTATLFISMAGAPAVWMAPAAVAADYPSRPVTLVVAFTPGGPSDVLARILGKKLEGMLGQPFVIENRPGAGGNVAAELVAHAAPDGYTLLTGSNGPLTVNPFVQAKLNYDSIKDFVAIGLANLAPHCIAVNEAVPAMMVMGIVRGSPSPLGSGSAGCTRCRFSRRWASMAAWVAMA